jgi:hypothetical protein
MTQTERRARAANSALNAYASVRHEENEPKYTVLVDLLTDLRWLSWFMQEDDEHTFEEALTMSKLHFQAERDEVESAITKGLQRELEG